MTSDPNVKRINISLRLADLQVRLAIRRSLELSQRYPCEFLLGDNHNYPHITLCSIAFPSSALRIVNHTVSQLAAGRQPIQCQPTLVKAHQRYIQVHIEPIDHILALHAALVDILQHHRAPQETHSQMDLTPKQLEYLGTYGYPDSFELYSPYLTITRVKEGVDADEAAKSFAFSMNVFLSSFVTVYLVGDHGTCIEKISEYPFARF